MRKKSFEKVYPLLKKFILDENVQQNMISNSFLLEKYNSNQESIKAYLFELDKRFDIETINKIIVESIIKLDENLMRSIIISYLNSKDESTKSNPNFISFFNKTSNYGVDSIKYMEKNGLVTNRSYREVPNLAIDAKYIELKDGTETFKNEPVDSSFKTLSYGEKKVLNKMIENNTFKYLDSIFEKFDISLKNALNLISTNNLDVVLSNKDFIESIDNRSFILLILSLLDCEDTLKIVDNLKTIIDMKRYDLVIGLVTTGKIYSLSVLTNDTISNMTDQDIYNVLSEKVDKFLIKEAA